MYLFYLDASGNSSLSQRSINNEPYFVLTGLGLHNSLWSNVHDAVLNLKEEFFPDIDPWHFEIKSRDIRRCLYTDPPIPQDQLPWPWRAISRERLTEFVDRAFRIIVALPAEIPVWMWAVVIDKPLLLEVYGKKAKPPYYLAFTFLLQRFEMFLKDEAPESEYGLVVADEEHEIKQRPDAVRWAIDFLLTMVETPTTIERVIESPFFVDSLQYQAIQLVDLCAYCFLHACRNDDPEYTWFQRLLNHLHPHPRTGGYGGSGLVMFPENRNRRIWAAGQRRIEREL